MGFCVHWGVEVGWGGDVDVLLNLHTCWMLCNCVSFALAHMLDATPVMGCVGWGGDVDVLLSCTHAQLKR